MLKNPPTYCLYSKVYLTREEDDRFLAEVVRPLVRESLGEQSFRYFFFIRYFDDGYHLRLRFFGDRASVQGPMRQRILDTLAKSQLPSGPARVVVGKYRPELTRYGGKEGVRLAERLFAASSRSILDFLELRAVGKIKASKVEFALASGEAMLDAIGMNKKIRSSFFKLRPQKGGENRPAGELSQDIEKLTQALTPAARAAAEAPRTYWEGRSPELHEITGRLYAEIEPWYRKIPASLRKSLPKLASSYLHMHYNRLALFPAQEVLLRRSRGSIEG
jgi:thiopeptide-type bacteriocin biosynthesis protein